MKGIYIFIFLILWFSIAHSQENVLMDESKEPTPSVKKPRVSNFFEGKTEIPDPFSLRDPFKPLLKKVKKKRLEKSTIISKDGVLKDSFALEKISLDEISIQGIYVGENRRAVASAGGKSGSFLLKEGMKIGPNNAEVKAILPGGIVVVEKIKNIYDQEEYLEIIIPISE
ncbi:MAG: hypothetical protein OXB88_03540 [Bacteriovoracales bacterium]|nr:hypothetical protein [Bacteriovoracales bacterium]